MDNSIDFDATTVAPSTGTPDPIPPARYTVAVTKIEKKPNDNGWGVKTEIEVMDGEYKGRKIFENYNLQHTNPDTVRIANEQFSALCHATGVLKPRDLSELLNKPFQVKVKIQPAEKGYDAKNRITGYFKLDGSKLVAVTGGAAAAAPAAKKTTAAPTWAAPQKKAS